MEIKKIAKIIPGQDGAIFGDELFRFNTKGECSVYDILNLSVQAAEELIPIAIFKLDRAETLAPHCNAVCFGNEFYEDGDRYPLLYANVYNNYASEDNKMMGVCLVYRLQRVENEFTATLVQMIEIGFCDDFELWKAYSDRHGERPYGNFVIDIENDSYWAFVMRSEELGTRYFRFELPSIRDGKTDGRLNIKKVVLKKDNIKEYFDCEYHRFIQGAILHKGKIYSTEGFSNNMKNRPAIRIIDLESKKEEYFDLTKIGIHEEPEFIDFYNERCLYSDAEGNLYEIEF